MQIEQLRHVVGRHASHPALGADTPLALSGCGLRQRGLDLLRLLVARAIGLVVRVVRDEREVQLGLRSGRQVAQRGELAGVIPGLGHGDQRRDAANQSRHRLLLSILPGGGRLPVLVGSVGRRRGAGTARQHQQRAAGGARKVLRGASVDEPADRAVAA